MGTAADAEEADAEAEAVGLVSLNYENVIDRSNLVHSGSNTAPLGGARRW